MNSGTINHDNINKAIIAELLKDANITIKDLSKKLNVPLSTIQRRTKAIQTSSLLKKTYHLDINNYLGVRTGDILIKVDNGKTEQVIQRILQSYRKTNILSISTRLNHMHDVIVSVFYKSTDELYKIVGGIKSMANVTDVEWSESVQDVEYTDAIEALVRKL